MSNKTMSDVFRAADDRLKTAQFGLEDMSVKAALDRQNFLRSHVSPCPNCGETAQIQIKRFDAPAVWRCRICGQHFEKEPTQT
jgi:ribosomal protein L37AE/L43A